MATDLVDRTEDAVIDLTDGRKGTILVDHSRNGKVAWPRRKTLVAWLVPFVAFLVGATLWAVDHIEDDLEDATIAAVDEQFGVTIGREDVDFDYRDGEVALALPPGVSEEQAAAILEENIDGSGGSGLEGDVRSLTVVGDEQPTPTTDAPATTEAPATTAAPQTTETPTTSNPPASSESDDSDGADGSDDTAAELTVDDEVGLLQAEIDALQQEILDNVVFDPASDTLVDEAGPTLDKIAAAMTNYTEPVVLVVGHTDADGDEGFNLDLSARRAEAVTTYLMAQGVAEERLMADGRGEAEPVAPNDTDANKQRNRRVEFVAKGDFSDD